MSPACSLGLTDTDTPMQASPAILSPLTLFLKREQAMLAMLFGTCVIKQATCIRRRSYNRAPCVAALPDPNLAVGAIGG